MSKLLATKWFVPLIVGVLVLAAALLYSSYDTGAVLTGSNGNARRAIAAAEAQARRDSTHAARLDSAAGRYYALGRAAQDSATIYHAQSHALTPTLPADTASLRRFFADYTR